MPDGLQQFGVPGVSPSGQVIPFAPNPPPIYIAPAGLGNNPDQFTLPWSNDDPTAPVSYYVDMSGNVHLSGTINTANYMPWNTWNRILSLPANLAPVKLREYASMANYTVDEWSVSRMASITSNTGGINLTGTAQYIPSLSFVAPVNGQYRVTFVTDGQRQAGSNTGVITCTKNGVAVGNQAIHGGDTGLERVTYSQVTEIPLVFAGDILAVAGYKVGGGVYTVYGWSTMTIDRVATTTNTIPVRLRVRFDGTMVAVEEYHRSNPIFNTAILNPRIPLDMVWETS